MDVLVTGANGTIGTALRERLGDDGNYTFTWVDVEPAPDPDRETTIVDVRDGATLREHVEGHDAVVHLALNPDLNYRVTDVRWSPALADNLQATVAVHRAAVAAGIERLLFASSNHVVGGYEESLAPAIYRPAHDLCVDHESPVRPDSLYAVEKLFGEALTRFCAEHHGLVGFALRFGMVLPAGDDHPYGLAEREVEAGACERGDGRYELSVAHGKALWLSHRDLAALIDRCLRAEAEGFDVLYGVSDNAGRWLDLSHAREAVGYEPRDDGNEWDAPPTA
jgi:nucleoside-diphosphate-sugar epimerase